MDNIVENYLAGIENMLVDYGVAENIPKIKAYLKNEAIFIYGIPMKKMKALFKKHILDLELVDKDIVWNIISELMTSHAFEKQVIAVEMLSRYRDRFDSRFFFNIVYEWVISDIVRNWAIADQVSLNILAFIIDDSFHDDIKEWALSYNYLLRRISVTIFAEKELSCDDISTLFYNVENLLSEDVEYVIRASGWALRNVYNYDKDRYFNFIDRVSPKMPRIMLRNAIEHLDEDIRQEILISSKERRGVMVLRKKSKKTTDLKKM